MVNATLKIQSAAIKPNRFCPYLEPWFLYLIVNENTLCPCEKNVVYIYISLHARTWTNTLIGELHSQKDL